MWACVKWFPHAGAIEACASFTLDVNRCCTPSWFRLAFWRIVYLFGHLLLPDLDKLSSEAAIRLGEHVLMPPTDVGLSLMFT